MLIAVKIQKSASNTTFTQRLKSCHRSGADYTLQLYVMILLMNNVHHFKDILTSGVNAVYILETDFLLWGGGGTPQNNCPQKAVVPTKGSCPLKIKKKNNNNIMDSMLASYEQEMKPFHFQNTQKLSE